MSVFSKLQEARVKLHEMGLTKSGKNSYAGYDYFELADFLPQSQKIFKEIGLCGVVSFTSELATLTIHDTESDGTIVFTSPMGSAALKGCHEVQNIGATETYQRRYLWVTAMEIVELDPIDPTTGKEDKAPKKEAPKKPEYKTISIDAIADITAFAKRANTPIEKILSAVGVKRIDEIPAENVGAIINRLKLTIEKNSKDEAWPEGRE